MQIDRTGERLDEAHQRRDDLRLLDQGDVREKPYSDVADDACKNDALGTACKKSEKFIDSAGERCFENASEGMRGESNQDDAEDEKQSHGEHGGESFGNAVGNEDPGQTGAESSCKQNAGDDAQETGKFLHCAADKSFDAEKEKNDDERGIEEVDLEHGFARG